MRKAARFAVPMLALLLAFQAGAAEGATRLFGTGSTVTCDTTPNAGSDVDDTSVANTLERTIACRNDSSESVYIGGSSVSTGGEKVVPGGRYAATLAPSVVPKCYAANSTSITCTESFGSTPAVGTMGGTGSRVEMLASGTDTTINSTSTLLFSTASGTGANVIATLPSWCHTITFEYRIDSTTGGAPANLQIAFGGTDPTGQILASGTWIATTASAVSASQTASLLIGRDSPAIAYAVTPAGTAGALAYGAFLPRNFKITRLFSAAPTTTLSAPWRLYCIGG